MLSTRDGLDLLDNKTYSQLPTAVSNMHEYVRLQDVFRPLATLGCKKQCTSSALWSFKVVCVCVCHLAGLKHADAWFTSERKLDIKLPNILQHFGETDAVYALNCCTMSKKSGSPVLVGQPKMHSRAALQMVGIVDPSLIQKISKGG